MYAFSFHFFFSSRRRHTRCALVTGVQTCALPILPGNCPRAAPFPLPPPARSRGLFALLNAELGAWVGRGQMQGQGVMPNIEASPRPEIGRASCRERVGQSV